MEEIEFEEVEFDETLYQKNIQENTFPERDEFEGIGADENEDS